MAYEFFKNSAAVCFTDKIPTREGALCGHNFILLFVVFTILMDLSGQKFVSGADVREFFKNSSQNYDQNSVWPRKNPYAKSWV